MKVKVINRAVTVEEGDMVSFVINGKEMTDIVTYVAGIIVEGEKYDLTGIKLKKI
jgi:hypothetical protein